MDREAYIRTFDLAAKQYKLAFHVKSMAHSGKIEQRCIGFQYGGLTISGDDLKLSQDDAALASSALEHCSTFTLVVVVDSAFEELIVDRFNSPNADIVVASRIARIIRNAFSHDPFYPTWVCTNPNHVGRFDIPDVITLDTTALHGERVEWEDYGGPLVLLRFLRHCQQLLMETSS